MSSGAWGEYLAPLGAIFLVAILLSVTWMVKDVLDYQQSKADKRQKAATYYADQSHGAIYRDCMDVAGQFDRLVCVMEKTRAEQQQTYTKYDLEAQQDMAVATRALLWVSITGTFIAVVGTVAVILTLKSTTDQVELSRQALDADFRPWVSIGSLSIERALFNKGKCTILAKFDLINHGRSPALDARVHAKALGRVASGEQLKKNN